MPISDHSTLSSLTVAAADAEYTVSSSIKKCTTTWTKQNEKPSTKLPVQEQTKKNMWGPYFTDRQHFIDMHFC